MGYWGKLIGKEPIESHIIGSYKKRKESNLDYYKNKGFSENQINEYFSHKLEINSKITALKYSTGAFRIKISSEEEDPFSFFQKGPMYTPRYYLFDIIAPIEDIGEGIVKYELSDFKNNKSGIILLANSAYAILLLSKNDTVEYYG